MCTEESASGPHLRASEVERKHLEGMGSRLESETKEADTQRCIKTTHHYGAHIVVKKKSLKLFLSYKAFKLSELICRAPFVLACNKSKTHFILSPLPSHCSFLANSVRTCEAMCAWAVLRSTVSDDG